MAEGVNHIMKGAICHGSCLTFYLRNPQNLGICRAKILCAVHQTLFPRPNTYKRKKRSIKEKKRSGHARLADQSLVANEIACTMGFGYTRLTS